jgi:hypothetical protein
MATTISNYWNLRDKCHQFFSISGHTEPMRKSPILAGLAIAAGITILACGGTGGSQTNDFQTALARLRQLSNATNLYIGDHDDTLPLANRWMDGLAPYVTNPDNFVSPAVGPSNYGFALNSGAAGRNLASLDAAATLLIFDSTVLGRNATALTSTQPSPGRYNGTNSLLYLDGRIPGYVDPEVPPTPLIDQSVSRVGQLATAAVIYSGDYDDALPLNNWVDATSSIVTRPEIYRSPIFDPQTNQYGYSYNVLLVGANTQTIENPALTILFFDSVQNQRNSVDVATNRPTPGRYGGQNAVSYANGSKGKLSP